MFKKTMSYISILTILSTLITFQATTAFAAFHSGSDTNTVDSEIGEDDYDYDYDYDDDYEYDWYGDDNYDYNYEDYQDYNWDTENWEEWGEGEDWDSYWDEYQWEEGEWDDMALGYYDFYYEIEDLFWMVEEIDNLYAEYTELGVEMPADIEEGLSKVSADLTAILANEKISPLYDIARDAIEYDDDYEYDSYLSEAWEVDYSADLEEIFDILDEFWMTYPWDSIDMAWQSLDVYWFQGDMKTEMEYMLEELTVAQTFVDALVSLGITDKQTLKAIANLEPLVPEARIVLDKMIARVDEGLDDPEEMDEFWDILDSTGEVFLKNLEIVGIYFENHPEDADKLMELIPDESAMVMDWLYGDPFEDDYNYYEEDYHEDYNKYYGDIEDPYMDEFFMKNMDQSMMDEIFRNVSSVLMEELSAYLEDEIADAIIANVMNSMDVFGEDLANGYLKNQAAVLKKMDFDVKDAKYHEVELEELANRTKATVIPDKYKSDIEELWEN
ncbi:MAG: hypothetical protein O3B47_05180, partial [bacterium]|nr:hypothetical protein [bacterium]